jgi:curved DNA-binding protein CbpA
MTDRDSLYGLFGVPPACTDEELRQAYVRAVFQHHPDRNPNQLETATAKTQLLVSAFKELKDHRTSQSAERQSVGSDQGTERTVGVIKVTFRFPFDGGVDVKDIANRKTNLRDVWEKFRQNPSDPVCALRMVHAAFRAGQQDSFKAIPQKSLPSVSTACHSEFPMPRGSMCPSKKLLRLSC